LAFLALDRFATAHSFEIEMDEFFDLFKDRSPKVDEIFRFMGEAYTAKIW
jgi:hypothetical protein